MKLLKKLLLIVVIAISIIFVTFKVIGPLQCFSQKFVEDYVAEYSKDFTLLRKESYSIGIGGFIESNETDWYFHDNELDFDFHVKTLKSEYPPKGKHISCNYYDYYMEKIINVKGKEIKKMITDMFTEIYDIEKYDIDFYHNTGQIRVYIDGLKNKNFSELRYLELCQIASKKLWEYIEKYDFNFKNRNMKIGWDVNLNTNWSDTDKDFSININGKIFNIKNYYN